MTRSAFVTILLILGLALLPLSAGAAGSNGQTAGGAAADDAPGQPPREEVELAGRTFCLELAADEESRTHGLMGHESIDPDGGMLFVFPRTRRLTFWMADCLIDIDVIFVDPWGRIVATHAMKAELPQGEGEPRAAYEARLKRYSSRRTARFAIELRAGLIEELDLKVGDQVELDLPRLKRLAR